MTTTTLYGVSTHELRDGDVVLTHGMRVRITGEGNVSQIHPTTEASPTLWWNGEVLNPQEVIDAGHVPASWIREGWTIQGNGFARWNVERDTEESK